LGYNLYVNAVPVDANVTSVTEKKWDTNWEDLMLKRSVRQEHSLGVSGSDKTTYFFLQIT
jgi:hypothetical protein